MAAMRWPTQALKTARVWAYLIVIILGYSGFGQVFKEFNPLTSHEEIFYLLDRLIGFDVYRWAGKGVAPFLCELFGIGYLFYYPYSIGRSFHYWKDARSSIERYLLGVIICYSIGFAGYALLPALGPRYHMPGTFPPTGPLFSLTTVGLVNSVGSPWAIMPSLHVGFTAYVLFSDYLYFRKWFWLCLAPTLLLWISTMGLGFHYLSDVIAGIAIALFAVWLSRRIPDIGRNHGNTSAGPASGFSKILHNANKS